MSMGISLGQAKTSNEAKRIVASSRKRLNHIISYNKLNISPSKFRFKIVKEPKPQYMDKWKYPFYIYVYVPSEEYSWIFLQ